MTPVEIYMGERYYGTVRLRIATASFTTSEEQIKTEIENRLQSLKRQKYTIKIL